MWKLFAGLVAGVAIGLAIVPVYKSLTGPSEMSKSEIELGVLKHFKGEYSHADCVRQQYPTTRLECTLVNAQYPMSESTTVEVAGERIKSISPPRSGF